MPTARPSSPATAKERGDAEQGRQRLALGVAAVVEHRVADEVGEGAGDEGEDVHQGGDQGRLRGEDTVARRGLAAKVVPDGAAAVLAA